MATPLTVTHAPDRSRLERRLERMQVWGSLALVAIGLLVLAAWYGSLPWLIRLNSGLSNMKVNTALGFVLTGLALRGLGPHPLPHLRRAARWLGLAVIFLAGLTLLQFVLRADFGLDNLLFKHPAETASLPGRMSGFSAITLLLLGLGIWAETSPARTRWRGVSQMAAALTYLVGMLGLLGYLYHAPRLFDFLPGFGSIALHTAVTIVVAALLLALVPRRGALASLLWSPAGAGHAARQMLLVQIPLTLVFIGANVWLEGRGILGPAEAAAIRDLAIFGVLLLSGWQALLRLHATDCRLRRALLGAEAVRATLEEGVAQRTVELAAASIRAEASRAQLATLLTHVPAGIVAIDTRWNIVFRNPHYVDFCQTRYGLEPRVGTEYLGVFASHPEHVAMVQPRYAAALQGETTEHEFRVSDQPPGDRYFSSVYAPVRDATGTIIGAIKLMRDITAQRQAEAEAERQRLLLTGVMQTSLAAVMVKEPGGRYLLVNDRFARTFGRTPPEIVGRTDQELFPPALVAAARRTDAQTLAQDAPVVYETETTLAGGEPGAFIFSKIAVPDGNGGKLICGMGLDISSRLAAERALQTSERQLRITLDSAQVGLWDWQVQTGHVLLDPVWKSLLGYHGTELEDHVDTWRRLMHPEDCAVVEQVLGRHLEDSTVPYDLSYRSRHKDGTWRWMHTRGRVTEWGLDGTPLRMTGTVSDITALKEAERLIQERNRDLETLLHVTSHDLREPLRAIESFSRMTRERYGAQLDDTGNNFLDRVVRAAGRMSGLIDDIMRLTKARQGKVIPTAVPACGLVDEVLNQLEQRIVESHGQVTVAPDLPTLIVDPSWVTQALVNLVGNALKFATPGATPEVTISGYYGDTEVGLIVADRGPGVPPEHQERIFQLFQRAVGRDIEGSGAGLAIVQQVAVRHGGRAWVRARQGGGSEFIITFGRSLMHAA